MKEKALSDEELGVLIDRKVSTSVSWFGSKLSQEREKVTRYYNGELPQRTGPGSSSFVSTDVYDAIESMKGQLLETFASGSNIVKFTPTKAEDVEAAKIASLYTDYVVFQQNDGYKIFNDVIDDGLKARVGIVKVSWEEDVDYIEHSFEGLTEVEIQELASQDDVYSMDGSEDQSQPGTFKGTLIRKADRSRVCIETVCPEEFAVDPRARELDKKTFCVHYTMKTVDDLTKMGYDRDKLLEWNSHHDPILKDNGELLARLQGTDDGMPLDMYDEKDEGLRKVLVIEAYIYCRLDGADHPSLYKIVRVGSHILEKEEVDDTPFVVFVPLPIPHAFYGNNFGSKVIPAQNARTTLTRAILDHTNITTNPRMQVLKGGVLNPRELLDNRLGGVVNTTRPDAIQPIHYASLNPFVFQTLELIKDHNEQTTGISALSQGLNKDAISKQNSQGMVEKLISMSQVRQKVIARNFANKFLIPLYLKVYNIVMQKERREKIVELSGNWVPIDFSQWEERRSASVSIHLGYGEQEREANARVSLAAMLSQDPQLNRMFGDRGRFNMAKDVFEMNGIHNVLDYLDPPDKLPPEQPDPMRMKELQIEELKAQAMMKTAEAAELKSQVQSQLEQHRTKFNEMVQEFEARMRERVEDRKDIDIGNKIDIAQREMQIVEESDMDKGIASASPR